MRRILALHGFAARLVLAWPDGHDEVFPGVMAGRLFGRCAAIKGTAMIRFSSRMDTT